jgi:peptidyl-prolyl cis-trans isomerase D
MSALASQLGFRIEYGGLTPDAVRTAIVRDGHRAMLGRFVDPKGKFDAKSFNRTVRYRLNFKEDAFIEQQRLELVAQRMRGLLVSGVTVSPEELRDAYNRDNDTASLSYIRLAPESFNAALDTSDAAISAWAALNGDAIQQYYETNKYKYTNVEKSARARHILIKVGKDAPDADRTVARARIDGLLARAKAGEDFGALATANSEDEGSAKKGGDLGFNPRGVMVPEFDEAMFALSPGQVSSVVETEFGYHIIKLESFREGTVSLADATPEIAARIYAEKEGAALAKKTADALQAQLNAGRSIDELLASAPVEEDTAAAPDAAATAPVVAIPEGVSLSVQETASFPRNAAFIPGIGASTDMADAAFALTAEKPAADRVFEVDGNWFVVALKERKTPSDEDFAAKKEDIEGRLLAAKIITWMQDRISAMVDNAVAEGRVDAIVPISAARGQAAAPAPAKKASGTSDNSDG